MLPFYSSAVTDSRVIWVLPQGGWDPDFQWDTVLPLQWLDMDAAVHIGFG